MSFRRVFVASLLALTVCGSAMAAPLNLVPAKPDIFTDGLSVSYNAATDQFVAAGFAEELVNQALTHFPITGAQGYSISATIDGSGFASAGSLSITGAITGLGAGTPLLTGSLTGFGFPAGLDEPLEFLFQVTGGSLAVPSLYGLPGVNSVVGVILSQTGSNFIDWNHNFDNGGNIVGAVSDSFPIPEPASLSFAALAIVGCISRRRAR